MPNVEADASLQLTMNAKDNAGTVVDHVTSVLQTFRGAVGAAGLAAASAFISSIEPTTQYADVLERIHALTGLTTEDSSKLLAGFTASGYGADQSAAMIQRLSMRLGTLVDSAAGATTGGNAATTMFERLGISVKDAHGNAIPMTVLLPEIIDALNKIADPLERARVESQLFGRNFAELAPLLANGGNAFKSAMEDARRFGTIMGQEDVDNVRKFKDEQARLNEALLGLQIMLGTYIIPYLTQAIIWFENIAAAVQQFIAPIKDLILPGLALVAVFGSLIGGASILESVLTTVAGTMGPIGALITASITPFLGFIGVIGLLVAGFLLLKAAYDRFGEAHRALQPLVIAIGDAFQRAHDALLFFLNSVQMIGFIDALAGAMRILGFSFQDTTGVVNNLRVAGVLISGVISVLTGAVRDAIATWTATHDPIATLATLLGQLGVNFNTVQTIISAVRLAGETLRADWVQFTSTVLPALSNALRNSSGGFGSLVDALQRVMPVILTVAGVIVAVLAVAFQVLIQILIVVLPPAITLIAGAFNLFADAIDAVTAFVTTHSTVLAILGGIIGAVVLPLVTALAIQFAVGLVTGAIAWTAATWANVTALIAQNAEMISFNLRLAVALVQVGAVAAWQGIVAAATWAWTAAQTALNFVLDANPIGLIILAIAALVIGVIFAYQHSETFRNVVNQLWAGLQMFGGWLAATLGPILSGIGQAFGNLISSISAAGGIGPFIVQTLGAAFSALGSFVSTLPGRILSLSMTIGQAFLNGIVAVLNALPGVLFALVNAAFYMLLVVQAQAFTQAWNLGSAIINGISSALSALAGLVMRILAAVPGILQNVLVTVLGALIAFPGQALSAAQAIGNAVYHGIIDLLLGLGQMEWNLINAAINLLLTFPGVALRFSMGIGQAIWNGITGILTALPGTISGLITSAMGVLNAFPGTVYRMAMAIGNAIWRGIIDALAGLGAALTANVRSAIASLPGPVQSALHSMGLQHGAVVGPSYGGARLAVVGEGSEDEVVATMSQVMRAGAAMGGGTGGGEQTVILPVTIDGAVLTRIVLKRGGDKWKLQAGTLGSGA